MSYVNVYFTIYFAVRWKFCYQQQVQHLLCMTHCRPSHGGLDQTSMAYPMLLGFVHEKLIPMTVTQEHNSGKHCVLLGLMSWGVGGLALVGVWRNSTIRRQQPWNIAASLIGMFGTAVLVGIICAAFGDLLVGICLPSKVCCNKPEMFQWMPGRPARL